MGCRTHRKIQSEVTNRFELCLLCSKKQRSSLTVVHKVGNIGISELLKYENISWIHYRCTMINNFSFHSKHHDKCKFLLKLIQLATISNLFPSEVVLYKNTNFANSVYFRKTRTNEIIFAITVHPCFCHGPSCCQIIL